MGTKISALTALTTPADADVLAIVDDDASATKKITWLNLKNSLTNLGKTQRAQFSYKDTDEIYADAGFYDCDGKIAWWGAQLTLQLAGASGPDWYYVYLDYSAITSNTELTNSEFLYSTTEPTWNAAKMGWYSGSDRCIFAVWVNSSDEIVEFYHSGDLVHLVPSISDLAGGTATTFTAVSITAPVFGDAYCLVVYHQTRYTAEDYAYYRPTGSTNATGIDLAHAQHGSSGQNKTSDHVRLNLGTSQQIDYKLSNSSTDLDIKTQGYYFPVSM